MRVVELTFILFFCLTCFSARASVSAGNNICPQQFEGQVDEIVDEVGPETAFASQKIIFTNHHTVRGDVQERVVIEILKNGPFEIQKGKDYRVSLRKGRLCSIELL